MKPSGRISTAPRELAPLSSSDLQQPRPLLLGNEECPHSPLRYRECNRRATAARNRVATSSRATCLPFVTTFRPARHTPSMALPPAKMKLSSSASPRRSTSTGEFTSSEMKSARRLRPMPAPARPAPARRRAARHRTARARSTAIPRPRRHCARDRADAGCIRAGAILR